jgi:hypothetical protein
VALFALDDQRRRRLAVDLRRQSFKDGSLMVQFVIKAWGNAMYRVILCVAAALLVAARIQPAAANDIGMCRRETCIA